MSLLNNRGCIFSKPKSPTVQAAPAPTPPPTPTESQGTIADEETRRRRISRQRMGLAATIKTSPRGILGGGAELSGAGQTGKTKLGA